MEREERIRHQKEFLIKFAYWAVWGGLVLAAVKLIGPVLLPFIAAFLWLDSLVSSGVCDGTHAYKARDCSGGGRSAVLRTGGAVGRIPRKPHRAFGTGTARGSGAVCLGNDFPDDETFLRVDGRPDRRDGGRGGAAHGGHGVGGGGQPGGELLTGMSGTLLQQVSGIAVNIPGMCFKLLLAVISTVFMELDFPQIMRFLEKIIPKKWKETVLAVKKGNLRNDGKMCGGIRFHLLMTFAELAAGLLLLRIEGAFCDSVSDRGVRYSAGARHGNRAASVGGDCVCRRQCQNGNRGDRTVSDHHSGAQHCGAEAWWEKQMGLSPVVMLPCMIVGLHFFGILGLFGVPLLASFLKKLYSDGYFSEKTFRRLSKEN